MWHAVGVVDPDVAAVERFEYDAWRFPKSSVDPLGRTTRYVYDRLGRLYQRIDPSPGTGDHPAGVTTHVHDASGNVIRVVDARGATVVHTYDAMNRLASTSWPVPGGHADTDQAPPQQSFGYDGEGNLTSEIDPLGYRVVHTYDAQNQLIFTKWPAPGPMPAPPGPLHGGPVVSFTYDTLGNLRTRTDPQGARCSYQYDAFHASPGSPTQTPERDTTRPRSNSSSTMPAANWCKCSKELPANGG